MTTEIEPLSEVELDTLRKQVYGSNIGRHRLIATIDAERAKVASLGWRCDACAGSGDDPNCMCEGTGQADRAVVYLRERVLALEEALREARKRARVGGSFAVALIDDFLADSQGSR